MGWRILIKTRKFEWTFNNIKIENIILAPSWAKKFFFDVSPLLYARHCCKLQSCAISRKIDVRKPWENGKKTLILEPIWGPLIFFSWVLPLLVIWHCSKLSSYAILRKTNEPHLRNGKKPNFGPDFGLFGSNLSPQNFSAGFTFTSSSYLRIHLWWTCSWITG